MCDVSFRSELERNTTPRPVAQIGRRAGLRADVGEPVTGLEPEVAVAPLEQEASIELDGSAHRIVGAQIRPTLDLARRRQVASEPPAPTGEVELVEELARRRGRRREAAPGRAPLLERRALAARIRRQERQAQLDPGGAR